jgi:hypothetical protein
LTCLSPTPTTYGPVNLVVNNIGNKTDTLTNGFTFIPSGLALWLKADSLSTTLHDGDTVQTWPDSSGYGRDASQSTVALRPVFKTSVQNGKPVIRFNGVYPDASNANPYLSITAPASTNFKFAALQDFTLVTVAKSTTTGFYHQFVGNEATFNRTGLCFGVDGTGVGLPFFNSRASCCPSAYGTFSVNDNAWHILIGVRSGDAATLYVDTLTQNSVAAGAGISLAAASDMFIGRDRDNFFPWGGDIAEILLYSSALSTSQRGAVEQYLKTKYGI